MSTPEDLKWEAVEEAKNDEAWEVHDMEHGERYVEDCWICERDLDERAAEFGRPPRGRYTRDDMDALNSDRELVLEETGGRGFDA